MEQADNRKVSLHQMHFDDKKFFGNILKGYLPIFGRSLFELARRQDETVGDGTATVIILAAEFLKVCTLICLSL